ncbi:MAG TPA: TetR/AcrR family transcriptional regulator [Solirubrobacterales bacterium]|nr:TetR/AcrR family transcriptional regulator [Solirubrobacterales bacterium]
MAFGDSEKTRRRLLDATRELLESPGESHAGLERIAARAGHSRQAIYRHFGSRAGLLKAVLADIDERGGAEASVRKVLDAGDARAVLDGLVAWWAGYVSGFAGVARSVYAGRASDPALAAAWDDRMEALLGVCRLVVDRCADQGRLRAGLERSVATEMLWGMLSIPLWDQLTVDRGWSEAEYRERIGSIASVALLSARPARRTDGLSPPYGPVKPPA